MIAGLVSQKLRCEKVHVSHASALPKFKNGQLLGSRIWIGDRVGIVRSIIFPREPENFGQLELLVEFDR